MSHFGRAAAFVALPVIFIGFVQIWIISAGRLGNWPRYSNYYSQLADAFLHGRLHLRQEPPPGLLRLPDPYDGRVNQQYLRDCYDTALYQGHLYIYWGPVPALAAAVVCWVLRIDHPDFGDQYLVFALMFCTVIAATILLIQIKRRLFPGLGLSAVIPPVLSLGLGAPLLYTLARAAAYEAAIAAGQFFLLAGISAAWAGITKRRTVWLAVASLCWGLAAGSRVSLWPAVFALSLIALWAYWRESGRRLWMGGAAALMLPLIACAGLAAWYNLARFDSIFEFGLRDQLGYRDQTGIWASLSAAPQTAVSNLAAYLLSMPSWSAAFPYLHSVVRHPLFKPLWTPADYEPLIGLAWSQPLLLLAPVGVFACLRRKPADASSDPLAVWIGISACAAIIIGSVPVLTFPYIATRYLMDAVPCATILAAVGYWRVLSAAGEKTRRQFQVAAGAVVLWQSFIGILAGLEGFKDHFMTFNPGLYHSLSRLFHAIRF